LEYNNKIDEFCKDHILYIKSSPYHPQSNGIVEVTHKEIRIKILMDYSDDDTNFNFKLSL
jgi:hypothetical protein